MKSQMSPIWAWDIAFFLPSFIRLLLSTCCMPSPVLSSREHNTIKADTRFGRCKFWVALAPSKPHNCPPGSQHKPPLSIESPLQCVLHTTARGSLKHAGVIVLPLPPIKPSMAPYCLGNRSQHPHQVSRPMTPDILLLTYSTSTPSRLLL